MAPIGHTLTQQPQATQSLELTKAFFFFLVILFMIAPFLCFIMYIILTEKNCAVTLLHKKRTNRFSREICWLDKIFICPINNRLSSLFILGFRKNTSGMPCISAIVLPLAVKSALLLIHHIIGFIKLFFNTAMSFSP